MGVVKCVAVLTAPDTGARYKPVGAEIAEELRPGAVIWWGRCHTVTEARGYVAGCLGAHLIIWRDVWQDEGALDWPTFVVLREGRPIALAEVVR